MACGRSPCQCMASTGDSHPWAVASTLTLESAQHSDHQRAIRIKGSYSLRAASSTVDISRWTSIANQLESLLVNQRVLPLGLRCDSANPATPQGLPENSIIGDMVWCGIAHTRITNSVSLNNRPLTQGITEARLSHRRWGE